MIAIRLRQRPKLISVRRNNNYRIDRRPTMQEKSWFCSSLDIFAMLSLACAGLTLGGALWFADIVPDSLTFTSFHNCLAIAIISFIVSRLTEIFQVISKVLNPKLRRSGMATDTETMIASDTPSDIPSVVTEGKFPRAA